MRDEGPEDRTEAWLGAEVDKFLKKGIFERSLEDCGDELAEELYEGWAVEDEEVEGESEAKESELVDFLLKFSASVVGREAVCSACMSPKYFSVSFNASSWLTPAKATTSLPGLKKVCRYFSMTLLLMKPSLSMGHSRGLPNVLSLYAAI